MANRLVSVDSITQMLPGMVRESLEVDFAPPRGKLGTGPLAPVPALNIVDFGADPTGVADSTAAIRAAAAAGNHLYFPPGTFKVSTVAENSPLLSFAGQNGVIIDAREAVLSNPTSYTADTITPMLLFDNCQNVRVDLGEYVGYTLPTPATHLGYRGATLVQAINGTDGLYVNAKITNARYGVLTGAYATPAEGGCKNFDIRLRTAFCGYPLAAYLADGIRFDIDADNIHRAVYVAGCNDVRGVARWKNIYIAAVAVLITDALTAGTDAAAQIDPVGAATTSRGSSNVDITSIDKGSTVFSAETYCIGLSLSRVDPMTYRNIRMRYSVVGSNTLSTTVHGHLINSAAKTIWSRYAFNWEPHVVLDNVTVEGVVDKSALTVSAGAQGPFTVRTYETSAAHAGTIRGLSFEDVVIRPGSVAFNAALLLARGIASPVMIRGMVADGLALTVDTSATIPVIFDGSSVGVVNVAPLAGGSRIVLGSGTNAGGVSGTTTLTEVSGGRAAGAGPVMKTKEIPATLSGAAVTLTGAVPAGCLLLAVQGRITTAITGATGYQVGITGDVSRWANRNDTAVGSVFGVNTYALNAAAGMRQLVSVDLPSIAAGATTTVTVSVPGAVVAGTPVSCSPPAAFVSAGLVLLGCYPSAADTVTLVVLNPTAGAVDAAAASFGFWLLGAEQSPRYYPSNPDIIVTSKGSNFTGGVLRLVLSYLEFPTLTA